MTSYNATATLARTHTGEDFADEVHESDLAAHHVVTSSDQHGRAQITVTITAESLPQAASIARALLADYTDQVRLDVMTTAEYDRDDTPVPPLVTVAEAAAQLGVTRQAIQRRIDRGTLPARQVGKTWVIAAREIQTETIAS